MKTDNYRSFIPGKVFYLLIALIVFTVSACSQQTSEQGGTGTESSTGIEDSKITIGEAIRYKGLEIFPISLNEYESGLSYLTLAEAIEQKKLTIEETSNVNQLTVSNHSDSHIFIMAGDIIKGGKQDRTLGVDAIIPPHIEKMPIESYCVESGRWQQRGSENVEAFTENTKALSSRKLKLASKYNKNQSAVWANVADQQTKLNEKISEHKGEQVEVRSSESESSLQLTLESDDLNDLVAEYKKNLGDPFSPGKDIAGYAYAVNGELYGIDLFNDPVLFERLAPKLYESIIVEAIAEYDADTDVEPVEKEAVYNLYLHNFEESSQATNAVNEATDMSTFDSKDAVLFETENSVDKKWVHKNYIPKKEGDMETGRRNSPYLQQLNEEPEMQRYQNRNIQRQEN